MATIHPISAARAKRTEQDKRVADLLVAREERMAEHREAQEALNTFFGWEPDGAA